MVHFFYWNHNSQEQNKPFHISREEMLGHSQITKIPFTTLLKLKEKPNQPLKYFRSTPSPLIATDLEMDQETMVRVGSTLIYMYTHSLHWQDFVGEAMKFTTKGTGSPSSIYEPRNGLNPFNSMPYCVACVVHRERAWATYAEGLPNRHFLMCQGSKLMTNWLHMRLDFWLCA